LYRRTPTPPPLAIYVGYRVNKTLDRLQLARAQSVVFNEPLPSRQPVTTKEQTIESYDKKH